MKLTDKGVAALRPRRERYEAWDGDGFGVRVGPRGAKSWVLVYHHQGRSRRMTLGGYPGMGLADARLAAAEARRKLGRGEDPGQALVAQRRAERAAETVSELVSEYLGKHASKKRSGAEDRRILEKDVVPLWGRRKAKDITRRDVIALLDGIVERGAPIQANRTLAATRKMFNWAVDRALLPASPCAMMKAPARENRRDRALSRSEIAQLWRGLDDAGMSETIRLALKFQLATAQRKGEVINAEWDEFALDERMWTIPPEKSKNGMAHRVPLAPFALDLLKAIKANAGGARWLFPSPHTDQPVTGPAVDHALRNNRDSIGIEDVTPHDLRRTAASHMTSMGINRLVVSKVLNHAESGVTAVYDRHGYDAEKRHALEAWGTRLAEIVQGPAAETAKVVTLSREALGSDRRG